MTPKCFETEIGQIERVKKFKYQDSSSETIQENGIEKVAVGDGILKVEKAYGLMKNICK